MKWQILTPEATLTPSIVVPLKGMSRDNRRPGNIVFDDLQSIIYDELATSVDPSPLGMTCIDSCPVLGIERPGVEVNEADRGSLLSCTQSRKQMTCC